MLSDVVISKDSKHMDVAKFGLPARKSSLMNLNPTLSETSNPGSVPAQRACYGGVQLWRKNMYSTPEDLFQPHRVQNKHSRNAILEGMCMILQYSTVQYLVLYG